MTLKRTAPGGRAAAMRSRTLHAGHRFVVAPDGLQHQRLGAGELEEHGEVGLGSRAVKAPKRSQLGGRLGGRRSRPGQPPVVGPRPARARQGGLQQVDVPVEDHGADLEAGSGLLGLGVPLVAHLRQPALAQPLRLLVQPDDDGVGLAESSPMSGQPDGAGDPLRRLHLGLDLIEQGDEVDRVVDRVQAVTALVEEGAPCPWPGRSSR